jgi:hypothetical protein
MTDFSQLTGVRTCKFLQRSSSRFPQFSVRRLGRPGVASLVATSDFCGVAFIFIFALSFEAEQKFHELIHLSTISKFFKNPLIYCTLDPIDRPIDR